MIRIQLRHSGTEEKFSPHIDRLRTYTWGYNIYLGGRLFIAVRKPRKYGGSKGFFDLSFGRTMLRANKKRIDIHETRREGYTSIFGDDHNLTISYKKDDE